jgi:hypothetical protein
MKSLSVHKIDRRQQIENYASLIEKRPFARIERYRIAQFATL